MANMGFETLILIDPQCQLTYEAQQAAATGQKALQSRRVYSSWQEFYEREPQGLRIAFTARDGRGRAVRDLSTTLQEIKESSPWLQKESESPLVAHLIFGPEDWGLSGADLELAHYACSIPIYGENPSLNLSQAVLLGLFILRQNWGGEKLRLNGQQPDRKKIKAPPVFPEKTLKNWLSAMGFDLRARRINAFTVLRRMLLQNTPTPKELVILETVLQQSLRKLEEYNQLRAEKLARSSPSMDKT
jgi:tRNA/rRNA methyltransferase